MKTIYMIGYEKISLHEFIGLLQANHITTIMDIRENPFSMRKDFIKKYLEKALVDHGINYLHIKKFGNPRFIRKDYKKDKNTEFMLYRYLGYVNNQDVNSLTDLIEKENVCLMCYEANPLECHRTMLAYELFKRGKIDDIKDLRTTISRDEILLFCQNISNIESVLFRDYMHSWYSGATNREERISPYLSNSV